MSDKVLAEADQVFRFLQTKQSGAINVMKKLIIFLMQYLSRRPVTAPLFAQLISKFSHLQNYSTHANDQDNQLKEGTPTLAPETQTAKQDMDQGKVDVKQLMASLKPSELLEAADEYYKSERHNPYFLQKPFASPFETPEILINFAKVVQGIDLFNGAKVLDFGVGSCWSSRFLNQMGCEVYALDVSKTALEIGEESLRIFPPVGDNIPPIHFMRFDGENIELPDSTIDRVVCLDALHHVHNPGRVLEEMSRVLTPHGIAGFSEPGPNHSCSDQSQYEMRNYKVIENDIEIEEIWNAAVDFGFEKIDISVHSIDPFWLDLQSFDDFMTGGTSGIEDAVRRGLSNRRLFFLRKSVESVSDSRTPRNLSATVTANIEQKTISERERFCVSAVVLNTGSGIWRPSGTDIGAVNLGVTLFTANGQLIDNRFLRVATVEQIDPERKRYDLTFELPQLEVGQYQIELDMVSEDVAWFEVLGSKPCLIEGLEVRRG